MKAKDLIIFVAGFASGVLGAYLIGKGEFEARVAKEVDAAKEYYEKKKYRASDKISELKEEANDILNKYSTQHSNAEKANEPEKEVVSGCRSLPYAITPLAYASEAQEFDKVTLTYYEEDDILYYEDEEDIFDDRDFHLGPDGLSHFGELGVNVDEAYIRNEDEEIDYEIIRVHSSYKNDILGEGI